MKKVLSSSFLLLILCSSILAQNKKNTRTVPPSPTPQASPDLKAETPTKRNERPAKDSLTDPTKNNGKLLSVPSYKPVYFFKFERDGFTYPQILIEHDDAGKGKISFVKDGFGELLTDPIELSTITMGNIRSALRDLNFLDSTENYQYPKDFSNLGNNTFTVKKDGKERTAKYNWTENKSAKMLMDEYRRIGNEYTWRFELEIAIQNQPLLTPGLFDAVDSYITRNEISDPTHMVPYLTQLSTDERMPLMARNHATRLIKLIEKAKK